MINVKPGEQPITYQEILRQQNGWKSALGELYHRREFLHDLVAKHRDHFWTFTGCGTSYYLAQTASWLFKNITGIPACAVPASEILMYPDDVFSSGQKHMLVSLSRSGTTTEIVEATKFVRKNTPHATLAISCSADSEMMKASEQQISFPFQTEKSVVMTGSFSTMLLSVLCLAEMHNYREAFFGEMNEIADFSSQMISENERLIREICAEPQLENFVFLGQGPCYGIANEAALKVQEMSILSTQSFHSLEYRHGPMSTANRNTLVTLLLTQNSHSYEVRMIEDIQKLGARFLVIKPNRLSSVQQAEYEVTVPKRVSPNYLPILYIPVLQLLGFYKAVSSGINPDQPKNLSAVVKL